MKLNLARADTILTRTLGLLGKSAIAPSYALWLRPCSSVHTFGMRFSIGVFFINKQGVIVKTIARLQPNRFALCWQAKSVVETASFEIDQTAEMSAAVVQVLAQHQSCG